MKYFIFIAHKKELGMQGETGRALPCNVLCKVRGGHGKRVMAPPPEGASGELIGSVLIEGKPGYRQVRAGVHRGDGGAGGRLPGVLGCL